MISAIRTVTIVTDDLARSRALYEGLLDMQPVSHWEAAADSPAAAQLALRWGLPGAPALQGVRLAMPGVDDGGVQLVRITNGPSARIVDQARPYDHGYVKNLDFFTDDVEGAYTRFEAEGHRFLSPPVTYPLPWGGAISATEAHLPTADGVKISLARLQRAPRRVFGRAGREVRFTEVAAATQVVSSFDRALAFYTDVCDCVPAADTVVEDEALVRALKLPPGTRLRLAFIGPPDAVGGKVGLVAYEGPGVADARSLAAAAPPGARGVMALAFDVDDVDARLSRAQLHGATVLAAPADVDTPWGTHIRTASLRTPDGVVLEFTAPPDGHAARLVSLPGAEALSEGQMGTWSAPDTGRLLVARVGTEAFAIEDRCPHMGAPLSLGALRGRCVVCPWHGWEVDVATGAVTGGHGRRASGRSLRREAGTVCVRIAAPSSADSA